MKLFGVTVGLIADTPKQKSTQWLLWLQGQQLRVVYLTLETNCVHSAKKDLLLCLSVHAQTRAYGSLVVCLSVCLSITGISVPLVKFKS